VFQSLLRQHELRDSMLSNAEVIDPNAISQVLYSLISCWSSSSMRLRSQCLSGFTRRSIIFVSWTKRPLRIFESSLTGLLLQVSTQNGFFPGISPDTAWTYCPSAKAAGTLRLYTFNRERASFRFVIQNKQSWEVHHWILSHL